MTSDRGSEGGAELDLNTPVTPKSPGLNPNASVFLSKTPPSNPDNGQWEEDSAHSTESAENYQLNGDVGKGEAVYPPTPESPPLVASEYSTVQESAPPPPPPLNFTPDSNGNIQTEENVPMDGSIPEENLRQMLRTQLEYYFSRENLSHDSYLMSQMDSDQYVPIFTVANFRQVKRLTTNMELIVSVLRELANVQVDEKGERVRPNHNRCIVILREVPESTPVETVKELFSGENCPKFVSCEFAHNDSWYVTFESDETAQRAYQYLREDVKTFLGKPIMARIKAKTLIRTTMYRNGIKPQGFEQTASYPMQQQQGANTPGQQPRYNYSSVPTIQYVNGNQGFQFPPYNTIMTTAWAPPLLDPGMVLAMNGYQAVKIQNSGRQHYPTRSRNPKQSRHNSDRSLESRMNHERSYGGVSSGSSSGGSHRTSPRSLDGTQGPAMGPGPMYHPRRESAPNQPPLHIHQPPIPAHLDSSVPTVMPAPHQSPASDGGHKDQSLLSQRAPRSYRSGRRRKEEEGTVGARNSRTNSSQLSTKDARFIEPQFELEPTSFPPLPGSSNNSATGDIFESKLSDVVKGTARPGPKEVVAKTTTQQTSASPQPTKEPALISTMATTTASSTTSINNNNNNTPVAMVTATTTTTVSSPAATTTSNSGMSSMATLASSLPTPPPSPEKMERTTEQKYEPRFEKSQRSAPSHPQPSQHTAHSAANQRTSAVNSDHKGAESDHSTSKATPPNLKPVSLPEERQPVKLSYAQMVQRRSESENGTGERPKSEESNNGASSEPSSPGGKDQSQHKPHTLKEQSQTARQAPVNSRLPGRDSMRKDSDPKDQRQFVSRRAKENRERRSAAGRRSPNK